MARYYIAPLKEEYLVVDTTKKNPPKYYADMKKFVGQTIFFNKRGAIKLSLDTKDCHFKR